MRQTFYIKKDRLNELKSFIRDYLPETRFYHNPLDSGNDFWICLTMPVEEGNKLNELFNKWYDIDNPKPSNKKFIDKARSFFNCL